MELQTLLVKAKNDNTLQELIENYFFSYNTIDSHLHAIALFARIDSDMDTIAEIFADYLQGYIDGSSPKYQITNKIEKIEVMQQILNYKIAKNSEIPH